MAPRQPLSCVSHSLFVMAFAIVQCFIAARAHKQHHPSPPSLDSLSGLHILQLGAMETSSFTTVPENQANKTQGSSSTKYPRWGGSESNMGVWEQSVQFIHSVMSDSLWPYGLQHVRPPCPSPTPRAYSNSCPSSRWCHPTISSFVVPFASCLQSFPESGSSPVSQFFASGGQSIGVSASAPALPMNIQNWFPLGLTAWIPCSPRDSQESSPTPQFNSINSSGLSFFYSPTLTPIHGYWKNHSFDQMDHCWQSNVSAF